MTPELLATEQIRHLPILLVIGFAIFAGTVGARLFQWLRIPQVVGYIAIGLLVGRSGINLIDEETIEALLPFNFFALGVIGFMIGGELHRDVFKKHGRQFFTILVAEGIGAFVVVSVVISAIAMLLTRNLAVSIALGIVFGAISSATAPAATVSVLWENKARGVLTTAVFAVVALDDGLALVLYSIATVVAIRLVGDGSMGLLATMGHAGYELLGAVVLGVLAGVVLNFLLRRSRQQDSSLALVIGALALLIGAGRLLEVDTILTAMALGVTLANLAPRRSRASFEIVERFAPPIYVLFFVIVGAHLNIQGMPPWMWALALPYIVARSAGKIIGTNLGARLGKAPEVLRKYLGLCLFCQGGVAVGLAINAAGTLPDEIGSAVIMIIALTTFVVEILGPPAVKIALKKAGEIGLNVTEEDLVATFAAGDMIDHRAPRFAENATLANILGAIAESEANAFPVVDADQRLIGVITIDELKQSFSARGMAEWMVAADLMQPVPDSVTDKTPLGDALTQMRSQQLEFMPVVAAKDDQRLIGMLELRTVTRALSREIIRRRRIADGHPA